MQLGCPECGSDNFSEPTADHKYNHYKCYNCDYEWKELLTKADATKSEADVYVRELISLYKRNNSFDYGSRDDARTIGKRICIEHGYETMVVVCNTIGSVLSTNAARELEYVWNYIGYWRN